MSYFGSRYKGNIDAYHVEKMQAFESPYSALDFANREWDEESEEKDAARLLIVLNDDPEMRKKQKGEAYFQFTDSAACMKFVSEKCEIIWSNPENQLWNGNGRFMG